MTTVVAGILENEGKVLICRRRADQAHPLKWEFPGGKVELGETVEQALTRELREELGIETQDPEELMRYEFTYPGKNPILLVFLRAKIAGGPVENRIFDTLTWEQPGRLSGYDFLEGDGPFLTALADPESRTAHSGLR